MISRPQWFLMSLPISLDYEYGDGIGLGESFVPRRFVNRMSTAVAALKRRRVDIAQAG